MTKNQRKFSSLRTKARKTVQSNGKQGDKWQLDVVGSSDDEADAELLGLKKPKAAKVHKRKVTNGKRSFKFVKLLSYAKFRSKKSETKTEAKKPTKRDIRSPKPKPPLKTKKSRIVLKKKPKISKLASSDEDEASNSGSSSRSTSPIPSSESEAESENGDDSD